MPGLWPQWAPVEFGDFLSWLKVKSKRYCRPLTPDKPARSRPALAPLSRLKQTNTSLNCALGFVICRGRGGLCSSVGVTLADAAVVSVSWRMMRAEGDTFVNLKAVWYNGACVD